MNRVLYPVRLNGIGLDTLDPRIRVTNVEEEAPKIKITTNTKAKYDGLRVLRRERNSRAILVRFVLWERDKTQRTALLCRVMEWADPGGMLTLGSRSDMQIGVVCDRLPDFSGRDRTDEMEVGFTAYDPYWRGCDPVTVSLDTTAGTAATVTLRPSGTARETFLEFDIKNTGTAAMASANVSVNGMAFALSGLGLNAGQLLTVSYDSNGFLAMGIGGGSVMDKRSAASADDLVLRQRADNPVSVTTSQPARVTLRAWEQWL